MPHRCVVLEPYGGCRLDEGHEGMHDDQAGLSNALCVMAFFLGMEQGINEKLGMRLLVHQMLFGGPVL